MNEDENIVMPDEASVTIPQEATDDEFSLEAILAEFKGSAYIDGDKRTPRDILEERTRRILMEASKGGLEDNELYSGEDKEEDFFADIRGEETSVSEHGEPDNNSVTDKAAAESQVSNNPSPESKPAPRASRESIPEDVKIYNPVKKQRPANQKVYIKPDSDISSKKDSSTFEQLSFDSYDEAAEAAAVGSFVGEVMSHGTESDSAAVAADNKSAADKQTSDNAADMETDQHDGPQSDSKPRRSDKETLQEAGVTDEDILFFDSFSYADLQKADEEEQAVPDETENDVSVSADNGPGADDDSHDQHRKIIDFRKHAGTYEEDTEEEGEKRSAFGGKLGGIFAALSRSKLIVDELDDEDEPDPEEPDYAVVSSTLGDRSRKLTLRADIALAVSLVMAVMTVLYVKTGSLFGFCSDIREFTALMIILQLVVMILGVEILIRGVMSFAKGGPGAEALITVACLISYIAAFHYIRKSGITPGVPFCAVPAFSAAFAIWSEKQQLRAMSDALKTVVSTSFPSGVMTDYSSEIDRVLVKKYPGTTKGFYNNLVQADCTETAYRFFAPILIFATILLSVITSIGGGRGQYFWYFFAAMSAAAAAFSALTAFSFPFFRVTRRVRKSGAAIAGWSGADALFFSDGVRVTDDDLFPDGTLSLSGVKIFEDVRPEKAIMYTASLVIASGSGLSRLFSDLLANQGLSMVRVDDFECYEGGVGSMIRGEKVLVGSAAFMNLMGIRVPQALNLKNAVFSAVNGTLVAVFAVNYVPVGTVQSALVSLLKSKTKLYFAVRDFNITPLMLQQKFKVPVHDVEHLPVHDTYAISSENEGSAGRAEAVLCREGLGPLAEAVTGAKRLRTWTMIATIISVVSAIIGLLLVFFMCWQGGFASVSPITLLLYMLAMFIAVILAGCMATVGK